MAPEEEIKDPFYFELLNLKEEYSESDLVPGALATPWGWREHCDMTKPKDAIPEATDDLAEVSVGEAWGAELGSRLDRALAGERGRSWTEVRADMRAILAHRKTA